MSENKVRHEGLTRRELLGKAAMAGLGLAASSIAGGPLVTGLRKPLEETEQQSFQPVAPVPPPVSTTDVILENNSISVSERSETLPVKPVPLKKELFFVDKQDEKIILDAQQKIDAQIAHYKRREKDLAGRINRTLKYRDTVTAIAKKLGFKPDSPVPELLLDLIFVESGGNPEAIAGKPNRKRGEKIEVADMKRARGLCQVRPDTAKEVAERLSLQTDDNFLFDPETNITLALEYLDHLYSKLFPDLGLAFWAYHLGEGNMTLAIKAYLTEEVKVSKELVDSVLSNKEKAGTFDLVKNYELTFLKLVNSKKVRERLDREKAFNDDTEFYVPRIGAAMHFFGA